MQIRNNYYFYKSALTPKQCTDILEAGMSELVKKSRAYGDAAITAQTADGKEKAECKMMEKKQVMLHKLI